MSGDIRHHLDFGIVSRGFRESVAARRVYRRCGVERNYAHFRNAVSAAKRLLDELGGQRSAFEIIRQNESVIIACGADVANNHRNLLAMRGLDGRRECARLLWGNDQRAYAVVDQRKTAAHLLSRRSLTVVGYELGETKFLHLGL